MISSNEVIRENYVMEGFLVLFTKHSRNDKSGSMT